MSDTITMSYEVPADDFTRAGEASSNVKSKLKIMGVNPDIIRKVAISMYEGEINMVIHATGGKINVIVSPEAIEMILMDQGPVLRILNLQCRQAFQQLRIISVLWVLEQGWDCLI